MCHLRGLHAHQPTTNECPYSNSPIRANGSAMFRSCILWLGKWCCLAEILPLYHDDQMYLPLSPDKRVCRSGILVGKSFLRGIRLLLNRLIKRSHNSHPHHANHPILCRCLCRTYHLRAILSLLLPMHCGSLWCAIR